ncbi:glycosyl transferase family 2 [Actinoplanes sp. NBRC 14428]|uniref:Glycosyl transferase family 2 n=1 Tax=Pseudosporangium ferrugineum TaxID=439699 RepID=A0A2T0SJ94_9ACTN|nr:glycosyltransferase family 2 protein [Pseudosporangium ferrugineum]PRY33443.1 glycosyl transferase family 2 [Pseudosporangium ferrugineum]BCJ48558.1 glycosyl transferase family 2 [Actinoplanes sp. NBRC 14428]
MEPTPRPAVSIVIPTHSEQRWASLVRTVAAVKSQRYTPAEIIVVVDHNPALYRRARRDLGGVTVLENLYGQGVSGNRNTGAFHTSTSLIAFVDDDVIMGTDWLGSLVVPFADPRVIGAGGGIAPAWEGPEPRWMPEEFLWAVGGSYAGLPTTTSRVRNVWSAGMVVRRSAFLAVGGFRTGFGKLGDRNRPEDTELCLRMSALDGGHWMYVPDAMIRHEVPAERSTFAWFLRRCYAEGRGKVAMAGLLDGTESLGSERDYLRSLPRAVLRNLAHAGRGRGFAHALKAGGVLAGVAAAGWGGVVETVTARRTERRPETVGATR